MDVDTYASFINSLKESLVQQNLSAENFTLIIQDCERGIIQCMEMIINMLESTNLEGVKLNTCLQDAIEILQMLSDFVKKILESMVLTCANMKLFPTTVAKIILSVFNHCKDSEHMYGEHLNKVQQVLKDLFRTCHELQVIYLMALENHFTFNVTEVDELNILLETLDLNLKIGDVAQLLDIKTMAAQWKYYTSICDKYSKHLLNRNIYNKCSKLFANLIRTNMRTALEVEEEKIALRSIKVASFGIMILLKLTNTFKDDVNNDYEIIVCLLLDIVIYDSSYLKLILEKSTEFINLVEKNVSNAFESLLAHLLLENNFLKRIIQLGSQTHTSDEEVLSKLMLVISVIKGVTLANKSQDCGDLRVNILKTLLNIIPNGHVWFNIGLEMTTHGNNKFGLFEHLLVNTLVYVSSFTTEEFSMVERILYETVLSCDSYSALFAANLWILLIRLCGKTILTNTLQCLIRIHHKLSQHNLFDSSPQKIHMTHLLRGLFENVSPDQRLAVCKQYNVLDENHFDIWIALRVSNLPNNVEGNIKKRILERICRILNNLNLGDTEQNDILIKLINLAATCSCTESNQISELFAKAWRKACPVCIQLTIGPQLNVDTLCLYKYVDALTELVRSAVNKINKKTALQIIHVMSTILKTRSPPFVSVLLEQYCNLWLAHTADVINFADNPLDILSSLATENRTKILVYNVVMSNIELYNIVSEEPFYKLLSDIESRRNSILELKEELLLVSEGRFAHKCLSSKLETQEQNNFDLADIDSLFDTDGQEPASKRVKLNLNEADDLLNKLEEAASELCAMTVFSAPQRRRVSDVCNILRNICEQ
ncbi:uncharacterized protein C1orf112 homolog isoform X2 [Leptidea sinapis]|nr:uncharacterized protein C1orf112 homolog isoform X2 [Leptidea sinapis]